MGEMKLTTRPTDIHQEIEKLQARAALDMEEVPFGSIVRVTTLNSIYVFKRTREGYDLYGGDLAGPVAVVYRGAPLAHGSIVNALVVGLSFQADAWLEATPDRPAQAGSMVSSPVRSFSVDLPKGELEFHGTQEIPN